MSDVEASVMFASLAHHHGTNDTRGRQISSPPGKSPSNYLSGASALHKYANFPAAPPLPVTLRANSEFSTPRTVVRPRKLTSRNGQREHNTVGGRENAPFRKSSSVVGREILVRGEKAHSRFAVAHEISTFNREESLPQPTLVHGTSAIAGPEVERNGGDVVKEETTEERKKTDENDGSCSVIPPVEHRVATPSQAEQGMVRIDDFQINLPSSSAQNELLPVGKAAAEWEESRAVSKLCTANGPSEEESDAGARTGAEASLSGEPVPRKRETRSRPAGNRGSGKNVLRSAIGSTRARVLSVKSIIDSYRPERQQRYRRTDMLTDMRSVRGLERQILLPRIGKRLKQGRSSYSDMGLPATPKPADILGIIGMIKRDISSSASTVVSRPL